MWGGGEFDGWAVLASRQILDVSQRERERLRLDIHSIVYGRRYWTNVFERAIVVAK